MKLDRSNTYDRVGWSRLEIVLQQLGFCEKWRDWVDDRGVSKQCHLPYSLFTDREPRGRVISGPLEVEGRRFDLTLVTFFNLLCAEALSRMIGNIFAQVRLQLITHISKLNIQTTESEMLNEIIEQYVL